VVSVITNGLLDSGFAVPDKALWIFGQNVAELPPCWDYSRLLLKFVKNLSHCHWSIVQQYSLDPVDV
tara:strand:- start:583 stop:783 length:201 start_codon:yes stop_codon:yes gene_type:complete